MKNEKYVLSQPQIDRIAEILARGDRVEICGGKEGVKLFHIQRKSC